jgi:hypothetical protein
LAYQERFRIFSSKEEDMKVKLCYTAENADSDWLVDIFEMNQSNYMEIINRYHSTHQSQADALSRKWELDGNPDPLYLNFRSIRGKDILLFRLIDQYMDTL